MSIHLALLVAIALAGLMAREVGAEERELVGHWKLAGDTKDSSGSRLDAINHGVTFHTKTPDGKTPAGSFDGKSSWLEVKTSPLLRLGTGDFTLALWVHTPETLDDDLGDLVTLYDAKKRVGFNLSLRNNTGVTSSQANTRQLQFGIDAGSEPKWTDEGRPGNAVLAFALAVYDGSLYAGTASNDKDEVGRVYRYVTPGRWVDCGAPDKCNAISALAVHQGKLYAASSKYRFAGSALPESGNPNLGGRIYRYEGEKRWVEVGQLPDTEAIGGLVVYKGRLYASSLYRPAGFFRYEADSKWTTLEVPDGKRVESLAVFNGHLWAGSYDGGRVYRYDGSTWKDFGQLGDNTQTYSFAIHRGRLCVGTWPSGKVYRLHEDRWEDLGRLGNELEVMGLLVHNGQLYAGTLPLAEVYRYEGGQTWTKTAQLDRTPDVKYRRAWTMAQYQGKLWCSTLPSGHIHSLEAGPCVTHDRELTPGWHHIAAVKQDGTLRLYVDGRVVAESTRFDPMKYDLSTDESLHIGSGAGDFFHGALADVRLYRRALSMTEIEALRRPFGGSSDQGLAPRFRVPDGFVIEKVAGPPLVRYPLFASFDDRGRLFVAEGTGTNLPGSELAQKKLGRILLLEDTDGDGKFDKSTVFADQLVFPQGVLWHDGAVYTASHPSFWRLEDSQGLGKADRRIELLTGFKFNGNGCDIHGPFLGPDGRLYWTDGRHGYKVKTREGQELDGLAARIWRCRTDGTDVERLCGGGFDNPVQLAFSPEGDLFGTMDQGPGDALLHYVEGAVFPMEHPCLKEFVKTGPLLGTMKSYPAALPAGLCGFMRYRSDYLGKNYQNTFFATHYVQHKIVQTVLTRDGATFHAEDRDFLTTTDHDVRITDVVEDADGSLLFVDMGGWFTYGFPGNPLPKPEVLGAIYRIRRADAPRVADPWGKSLHLATRSIAELTPLLDDPRPKVRDQVVALLAKRGLSAVTALATVVRDPRVSVQARRNAVWSLCRMEKTEAQAVLRLALADSSASVRQAAVHAVGLQRDVQAVSALRALIAREEPALRLKVAEALGRIGNPAAVPDLLAGLAQGGDPFLEHALIYALIRIKDRASTLPALTDRNPRVRRAGLIALDQMTTGALTRELVVPLLDTDDLELQQTALAVISRHEGWAKDTLVLLRSWLRSDRRTPEQERALMGALLAFCAERSVQDLVAEVFADSKTTVPTRLLVLSILSRCQLDPLPPSWLVVLQQALEQPDLALRREAVAVVKVRSLDRFDVQLATLSQQASLPADLRIAALEGLAPRRKQTDPGAFALLTRHLSEQTEPLLRIAAARTLGASALDSQQLKQLAQQLPAASTLTLRLLLPAFAKASEGEVGKELAAALTRAPGATALSLGELDQTLRGYPAEVQTIAQGLREKLTARQKQQAAYLAELSTQLGQFQGDTQRGREVFFSRKVGCYGCHRAAGTGGQVGPDLSQIGRFRSRAELLESIVFPSLVIAPEFRSYRLSTKSGKLVTGLIVREGTDAIHLRTPDLAEVRIARTDLEEMEPSNVSLMPDGLEKILSRQELCDLLEFLAEQR